MTAKEGNLRPLSGQIRLIAGLILGLFVAMHLANHALGLISVHAQESARPWIMGPWHSPVGQFALYGGLILHASLGLHTLARRRHYRMPRWEATQLALGLAIPYFLLTHIVNTRGTRILTGIDIDYVYEITNLWLNPVVRFTQTVLVLLVWGHFAVGLHFWLRLKPWYRRAFPLVLVVYVLVPMAALLGFAQSGVKMSEHARADPAWAAEVRGRGTPHDAGHAQLRTLLRARAGTAWVALVGFVFLWSQIRNWAERRRTFGLSYPEGPTVRAPWGMSILEASRMADRPHTAACGGRGRCTTCRVRIVAAAGELPPPTEAEFRALQRIGAPPGVRLACQTRPRVDVRIQLLISPAVDDDAVMSVGRYEGEFGREQEVTVVFIDVRGSTKIAENRLPYDVVFLLNQFFAAMSAAVEGAGGHYSNFTGDGLMALFGLTPQRDFGSRAALTCACDMLDRLDGINERLLGEMETPLKIGVGVHTGMAIIGRMGPPKTPIISALGDTVNTTARLEELTKSLGAQIVASVYTLHVAGLRADVTVHEAQLRGRAVPLPVAPLDRETLRRMLGLTKPSRAT